MPPLTDERRADISNTLNQVEARASQLAGNELNSVDASRLTQPVSRVNVPEPAAPTIPRQAGQLVTNITRDVDGFISAQTEEAKQLRELQATYGQMNEQGSLSSLYNSTLEDAGITGDSFKELKDIQLQLADMDTGSELTKTRIAGAAGQTMNQASREVTQEDRENAVRSAGLAARAAVISGNIQTAQAAASQAVNIAFQDRQLTATNLLNQIEMVQGQVDQQTGQLLEQEKRNYQAELAKIEEVKGAISNAIVSGGASQAEIAQMTNPNIPDEQKLALAQGIMGRTAGADRALDRSAKLASITTSQLNARASLIELAGLGDPSAIEQLGYDPRNTGLTFDEVTQAEGEITQADVALNVIDEMLDNSRGLGAVTGQIQSPGISGFFQGGKAEGAGTLTRFTPIVGNIQGAIQSRNDRDNILSDIQYIYNTEGFQEFIGLKESGLTFGSLTEGERGAIFSAANEFNSSIERDPTTGQVTGYRGTDDQFVKQVGLIQDGLQAYRDEKKALITLTADERNEIINTP